MNNYTVSEKETRQAEQIRRQYIERSQNKMEQLRDLDSKVKKPGTIAASIIGVIGTLIMGSGMSMTMLNKNMAVGIVIGVVGMIIAGVAYPIYKNITDSRKKKYADEIMQLSSEIVNNTNEKG